MQPHSRFSHSHHNGGVFPSSSGREREDDRDDQGEDDDSPQSTAPHPAMVGLVAAIREFAERSPATMAMASLAAGIGVGVVLVKLVESRGAANESPWGQLGKKLADSVGQAIPEQIARAAGLFTGKSS